MLVEYEAGTLSVPGYTMQSPDVPTALMEQMPTKPALNSLLWMEGDGEGGSTTCGVRFPEQIVAKWFNHPDFGDEFKDFYKEVTSTYVQED